MVDTSAAEFAAETPYFYSTYAAAGSPPEAPPVARPASLVIGSGPVRIGQGIEFDYCAVQASEALRRLGRSSIMVNSNPETVSTDFDASTRLYFESLDAESVLEVMRAEELDGEMPDAFVQFGGQTPLGLADAARGGRRQPARAGPRRDRPDRGAHAFRGPRRAAGHPPAGGRHGLVRRGGVRRRRAGRLSGHRAAVVRHRWPGRRLRVRAGRPGPDHRSGGRRRRRAPGAHRCVPGGHRARRRRDQRRHGRSHPGPDRARRARGRPFGRLDRHLSRAAHLARPTRASSSMPSRASRWRSTCAA